MGSAPCSGGARGFAYVGVIAVQEEAGLKPQLVVRLSQVGLKRADFSARKQSIDLGRAAMRAALPALQARLAAGATAAVAHP